MSELLQSGLHPDADQLNAFAEQVLPAHEHQETLAHLAVCADCRAVVALSTPPFEETLPQPDPVRRRLFGWSYGSRLFWPLAAAAAFAAIAAVGVHLRNVSMAHGLPASPQVAANHPPTTLPPPQPAKPSPPVTVAPRPVLPVRPPQPIPRATPKAAPAAAPNAASNAARMNPTDISALPTLGRDVSGLQPVSAPPSSTSKTAAGSAMATGSLSADGAAIGPHRAMPPTEFPARSNAKAVPPGGSSAVAGSAPSTVGLAPGTSGAEKQTTIHAFVMPSKSAARMGALGSKSIEPIVRVHPLPSGLAALSTATDPLRHRTLAVDSLGTLFLTGDSGEHWMPVESPWTGHATRVRFAYTLAPPVNGLALAQRSPPAAAQLGSIGAPASVPSGVASSSLSGTITDESGAIVPGATVAISALPAQPARTTKADPTGHYLFDGLASGSYIVQANSPGFASQKLSKVLVTAGKPAIANLALSIGAAAEMVTVDAASRQLELAEPGEKMPALAPANATPLSTGFEVTTDQGERWVSLDGLAWKRK